METDLQVKDLKLVGDCECSASWGYRQGRGGPRSRRRKKVGGGWRGGWRSRRRRKIGGGWSGGRRR
jgi:hypothetical protein